MKTKLFSLSVLLFFGLMSVVAQTEQKENFKVYGNCGMCENRIEKAAKSVDGVTSADWDKDTKMLLLTFDDAKTSTDKVQMAIAAVGHDTGKHIAKDEVYNALPGCCKYERVAHVDQIEKK